MATKQLEEAAGKLRKRFWSFFVLFASVISILLVVFCLLISFLWWLFPLICVLTLVLVIIFRRSLIFVKCPVCGRRAKFWCKTCGLYLCDCCVELEKKKDHANSIGFCQICSTYTAYTFKYLFELEFKRKHTSIIEKFKKDQSNP